MSATISFFGRPPGFMSTSISEEWTPSACSSSSARPVRRATCRTSGTPSSSRSATRPTRLDSASETPGLNWSVRVNEPSLNGGRKARGSMKAPASAMATATEVAAAIGSTPRAD